MSKFYNEDRDYVPGKSFKGVRLAKDKEKTKKIFVGLMIIISGVVLLLIIYGNWPYVVGGISILALGYYSMKSYKFHEDVDFVVNQAMEDLLEIGIDEKVVASYRNYDMENVSPKKDNNLMVVTNRKIFFATYNGNTWLTLIRPFEQLIGVGYAVEEDYCSETLAFEFVDKTCICLRMSVMDNLASNPSLFFLQFLNALDAYLLGETITGNKPRRRVSIGTTSATGTASEPSSARTVNLEISEEMAAQIKAGEEIGSGRRIEI